MNDRLYRLRDDRMLGGVAAGVADYFGIDPTVVRIVWAVLGLFSGGVLLVLYVVMWIVVPEEPLIAGVAMAAAGTPGGPVGTTVTATGPLDPASLRAAARAERRAERARARAEGKGNGGSGALVFGIILVVVGGWFLIDEYVPWIDLGRAWPLVLVGIGIVVLLGAIRPHGGSHEGGAGAPPGAGAAGASGTGTPSPG